MKSALAATLVVGFALAVSAQDEISWRAGAQGSFDDAQNWQNAAGEPVAPTSDMRLMFQSIPGENIVRFGNDTTVNALYVQTREGLEAAQIVDFDLAGKTLTIANDFSFYQALKSPDSRVVFRDGTVNFARRPFDGGGFNTDSGNWNGWGGVLIFTNATFTAPETPYYYWRIYGRAAPAEVRICGGSHVFLNGVSDQRSAGNGYVPKLVVTGEGTELIAEDTLSVYSDANWEISDGATVRTKAISFGSYSDGVRSVISNATVETTGWIGFFSGSASNGRVTLCGGAKFGNTGGDNMNLTVARGDSSNPIPHGNVLDVTGDSEISYTGSGWHMLEVSRNLCYGNELWVGDATISLSQLTLGGYTNGEQGAASNNCVRIYGPRANMTFSGDSSEAGLLNHGARLQYDIPVDGFADAEGLAREPLRFPRGGITVRHNPLDENQRTRILINADAFTRKHPKTRVTLLSTARDSSAAFEELAKNFIYTGAEKFKGDVTYDATHLYYTSAATPGLMIVFR